VKRWPPIVIAEGRCITGAIIYKETNMSSRPNASGSVEVKQPSQEIAGEECSVINSEREQEIRRRAYEVYLERGEEPGHDLEDWLEAERELASPEITSPGE
jgi:Protein of unknown function (DUF2934)